MTAAKTPAEHVSTMTLPELLGRIEWYVRNNERTMLLSLCAGEIPARLKLIEKRERALRLLLEQALDSLESAIGWPGIVAADDAVRTVEAIRDELVLEPNALAAADEGEAKR